MIISYVNQDKDRKFFHSSQSFPQSNHIIIFIDLLTKEIARIHCAPQFLITIYSNTEHICFVDRAYKSHVNEYLREELSLRS